MVSPPETLNVWPVMYSASSVAKKTTARAMSSGRPSRPHGMAFLSASANPAFPFANSSSKSCVSLVPEETQLA